MNELMARYEQMAKEDDAAGRYHEAHSFNPLDQWAVDLIGLLSDDGGAPTEFAKSVKLVDPQFHCEAHEAFERALSLCESPIERRLMPWLLCQRYNNFEHRPQVLMPGESDRLKPYTIALVPQLKIGRRRADFALAARRGGPVRFVIVECDGERFHADVHLDVARDAELLRYTQVLDVLPFTGREIRRDPSRCAWVASRGVTTAWAKNNPMTAAKFEPRA